MIGNAKSIRFRSEFFVMKLNDAREAAAKNSKASFCCPIVYGKLKKTKQSWDQTQCKWHDHQVWQLKILQNLVEIQRLHKVFFAQLTPTKSINILPGNSIQYRTMNPKIQITVNFKLTNSKLWLVRVSKFHIWKKKSSYKFMYSYSYILFEQLQFKQPKIEKFSWNYKVQSFRT